MPVTIKKKVEHGRLVFYREKPSKEFWDKHWLEEFDHTSYARAQKGSLWLFEDVFTKYLPKNGQILEGGCGPAKLVIGLRSRGYDCVGIDYAEETVRKVRESFPDLPIRQGDVLQLDVSPGTYAAYISLGVMEHSIEGPHGFLREAFRVLSSDGLLLVSVPFFNPLRRFKSLIGYFHGDVKDLEFYQYAFQIAEMKRILLDHKFHSIYIGGYDPFSGFQSEIPLLSSKRFLRLNSRMRKYLNHSRIAQRLFSHMILFVCRKDNETLTH
jgi:SAM-dependent methyltransferase